MQFAIPIERVLLKAEKQLVEKIIIFMPGEGTGAQKHYQGRFHAYFAQYCDGRKKKFSVCDE